MYSVSLTKIIQNICNQYKFARIKLNNCSINKKFSTLKNEKEKIIIIKSTNKTLKYRICINLLMHKTTQFNNLLLNVTVDLYWNYSTDNIYY